MLKRIRDIWSIISLLDDLEQPKEAWTDQASLKVEGMLKSETSEMVTTLECGYQLALASNAKAGDKLRQMIDLTRNQVAVLALAHSRLESRATSAEQQAALYPDHVSAFGQPRTFETFLRENFTGSFGGKPESENLTDFAKRMLLRVPVEERR